MKQAIVIRTDLGLSAGKAAAQAAHASLWAANRATEQHRSQWEDELATKIVLSVDSEADLRDLADHARDANIPTAVVNDAGRTEVDAGTTTALAVGPAAKPEVDAITGNLALYN